MIFLAAIVIGFAFGGTDQYVGSRIELGAWAPTVSQMSAPWLILPFAFGWTQRRPGRAACVGLAATAAALTGFFALTLSPIEGVALGDVPADLNGLLRSNLENIVGGAVTAPLCGLIGQRARAGRWWPGAVLVAGSLCLEPTARRAVGRLYPPNVVWRTELAVGMAVALLSAITAIAARRSRGAH
jgi:hypothetical protein